VFLMAAVIGIALFAELPRIALQAQRAKEQLLVERGEQFKRAIQLFLRANKGTRFPADMDDLDRGYNNLRFLRHRYKDPMTGKDEWRVIHMQGGVLVDSLLTKPKDSDKPEESTLGQNISAHLGLGETADAGQGQPNAITRRRQSEGGTGAGFGGLPGQPADQGNGAQPGDASGGTPPPAAPGTAGGPMSPFGNGSLPAGPPGQLSGLQPGNASGTTDSGSTAGTNAGVNPATAGSPPNGAMPFSNPGQSQAGANLIGTMLTTPSQRNFPGFAQNQAAVMPSGMAGVASKVDSDGLMVYNDRTNYKEWEFVYDPTKDRPRQDPRSMLVGNQLGTPAGSTPGTAAPSSQASPFSQAGTTGAAGQTGANGQTGTSSNTSGGQGGGSSDLRPGKK